ncbi:hypothetical protein PY650_33505 [Rhizobium calliandrae]|uniref:Uncharacterized protein n=1 Tax=Rhizobium calliandrae TaxID=1312182 RepID=A0ABT7KPA7_9HYPH|nr:hypothetical protein [Rhizobium calliandrae]MDL2410422.1 hypothetical protein [Rhizobium calliandrae]
MEEHRHQIGTKRCVGVIARALRLNDRVASLPQTRRFAKRLSPAGYVIQSIMVYLKASNSKKALVNKT